MSGIIVITRPIEEATIFAKVLAAEGLKTMIEPMLEIEPVGYQAHNLKGYGAVIFTSANGVRFGPSGDVKAYCVGAATAEAARARGYRAVSADGDGAALVEFIKQDRPGALLYIRGEDGAFPLVARLRDTGFKVGELIVYRARLTEMLSPACLKAIKNGEIEAVTFFSKRTAENFTRLMEKNGLLEALKGIKALSISQQALEYVRANEWAGAYVALAPNAQGMIRLIKDVCR